MDDGRSSACGLACPSRTGEGHAKPQAEDRPRTTRPSPLTTYQTSEQLLVLRSTAVPRPVLSHPVVHQAQPVVGTVAVQRDRTPDGIPERAWPGRIEAEAGGRPRRERRRRA